MILNELNKTSDKWASNSQSNVLEANVAAFGPSSDTYTISFKNGGRASNVSGPTGLQVGNAVVVANYPGKAKKYVIVQKAKGGGTSVVQSVPV